MSNEAFIPYALRRPYLFEPRKCHFCGKPYTPQHSEAKYCDIFCKDKAAVARRRANAHAKRAGSSVKEELEIREQRMQQELTRIAITIPLADGTMPTPTIPLPQPVHQPKAMEGTGESQDKTAEVLGQAGYPTMKPQVILTENDPSYWEEGSEEK